MIKIITAMEARKKFGEVLNRVYLLKEEIIIERSGKKIAKLCPHDSPDYTSPSRGELDFRKAAGLGGEIWRDIKVDEYLKREREAWD